MVFSTTIESFTERKEFSGGGNEGSRLRVDKQKSIDPKIPPRRLSDEGCTVISQGCIVISHGLIRPRSGSTLMSSSRVVGLWSTRLYSLLTTHLWYVSYMQSIYS